MAFICIVEADTKPGAGAFICAVGADTEPGADGVYLCSWS
jgi:hypothetical protein